MPETEVEIKLHRIVVDPARGPEAVHHFMWARAGTEFTLDAGYVDLLVLHARRMARLSGKEEVEPVEFFVTHRLSLSKESVERLHSVVSEMMASLHTEPDNATAD